MGPIVDGFCPNGYTVGEGTCCGSPQEQPHTPFPAPCIAEVQLGPCSTNSIYGETCGARDGYACNIGATGAAPGELTCCPTVDYTNKYNIFGPGILAPDGVTYECPEYSTPVMVDGEMVCVASTGTCPVDYHQMGPSINGICPNGYTVRGDICCGEQPYTIFPAPCIAEVQLGPCFNSSYGETCGERNGYACDIDADGVAPGELTCCPTVDYTNLANIIGPAILGPDGYTYECPVNYTAVMVDGEQQCVRLTTGF